MSEWSYAVIILTLIALGAVFLWSRRSRAGGRLPDRRDASGLPRNYSQERETTRAGTMSAEDQTWETDRLRREQAAHEEEPLPPERR